MQWIKYKIVCNSTEGILIDKKIGYSSDNLAIAQAEAYNGEYTIEEDAESFEKEPLAIEFGGTNAKDTANARTNLDVYSKSEVRAYVAEQINAIADYEVVSF